MTQYKCVFVILHYITNDDTEKCIETIKKLKDEIPIGIVVVDNCSPNKKYNELKDKFQEDEGNIFWLETSHNLGFANGNNYGYKFAKDELKAEYIICINNDTEIRQRNFIYEMLKLYQEYQYDILGPDIISIRDGGHQNPQEINADISFGKIVKKTIKCLLVSIKYSLLDKSTKSCKYNKINLTGARDDETEYSFLDTNIKLHGAALIFSPKYVKKFDTAFDARTFMYCEEDFLLWRSMLNGLKVIYSNRLVIYHKEFSSTEKLYLNKTNRQLRFKYFNMFRSYSKLLKAMLFDRRIT